MPELGEIRKGNEIEGKSVSDKYAKFVWIQCPKCEKGRWVRWRKKAPISTYCLSCKAKLRWQNKQFYVEMLEIRKGSYLRGEKNPAWRGGRTINALGYVLIYLYPTDFFYPMANKQGYVLEHRLVVAKHLNRCLLPWEIVHHKGKKYPQGSRENKSDNRYPENLQLIKGQVNHRTFYALQTENKRLCQRIKQLESEAILLSKK